MYIRVVDSRNHDRQKKKDDDAGYRLVFLLYSFEPRGIFPGLLVDRRWTEKYLLLILL
jgi:hypothetical protein